MEWYNRQRKPWRILRVQLFRVTLRRCNFERGHSYDYEYGYMTTNVGIYMITNVRPNDECAAEVSMSRFFSFRYHDFLGFPGTPEVCPMCPCSRCSWCSGTHQYPLWFSHVFHIFLYFFIWLYMVFIWFYMFFICLHMFFIWF